MLIMFLSRNPFIQPVIQYFNIFREVKLICWFGKYFWIEIDDWELSLLLEAIHYEQVFKLQQTGFSFQKLHMGFCLNFEKSSATLIIDWFIYFYWTYLFWLFLHSSRLNFYQSMFVSETAKIQKKFMKWVNYSNFFILLMKDFLIFFSKKKVYKFIILLNKWDSPSFVLWYFLLYFKFSIHLFHQDQNSLHFIIPTYNNIPHEGYLLTHEYRLLSIYHIYKITINI